MAMEDGKPCPHALQTTWCKHVPCGPEHCHPERNPNREEMLHHGMQMIAQDGNVPCCINPAFQWNELTQAMPRKCAHTMMEPQKLLLLE